MNIQMAASRLAESAPIIIDSFAGGGGASTGIYAALGRSPDIAINHNATALGMHAANHPDTTHMVENVWQVNIETHTNGRKVGLLWASPDCRHFSRARGAKPVSKSVRMLAWSIIRFVRDLGRNAPEVVCLENVSEFQTWEDFKSWKREFRRLGYRIQMRELRACDFGTPTIRKRLFVILRRDGRPIVWPKPTHGAPGSRGVNSGRLKPWRTAGEIIDWSIPCPSIFDTSEEIKNKFGLRAVRPLADKTMRRVAAGIVRYVLEAEEPYFVTLGQHGGSNRSGYDPMHTICASRKDQNAIVVPNLVSVAHGDTGGKREYPMDEPVKTLTGKNDKALAVASLIQMGYGDKEGQKPRILDIEKPVGTITAGGNKFAMVTSFVSPQYGASGPKGLNVPLGTVTAGGGGKQALISAYMAQHNTGVIGRDLHNPLSTITGRGTQQMLVAANMLSLKGTARRDGSCDEPHPTVCAGGGHSALVAAFLMKYYGNIGENNLVDPLHTITTKDRFGLVQVTIQGEKYFISDIGMRMLSPRELFRAQGFDDDYIIDRTGDGEPITKTDQVHKCGNSVPPPMVKAIVKANCEGWM